MEKMEKMVLVTWTLLFLITMSMIECNVGRQFEVHPVSVVQAEGLKAVFKCLDTEAIAHFWRIRSNGELLAESQFPLELTRILPSGDSPARLIIPATPQYNNTVVQCAVATASGEIVFSENATLKILTNEGIMDLVLDYEGIFSWISLFPNTTAYYVNVHRIESSELLESVLVNGTRHVLTSLGNNVCDVYTIFVIPTDGDNNGTSSTVSISGHLPDRKENVTVHCRQRDGHEKIECDLKFGSPLLGCTCNLTFTEIDNEYNKLSRSGDTIEIVGNGSSHYTKLTELMLNRKYAVEIDIIFNSKRLKLSSQSLTTHDILDASVNQCSINGSLNTSCEFVDNTNAQGYLAIVTTLTCQDNVDDEIFFVNYNTDGTFSTLDGAGEGNYTVSFFDLEEDGLPMTVSDLYIYIGAAAMREVSIPSGEREPGLHESTSPLETAAIINIATDEVCIYCPAEKCLILIYDCKKPDLLISLVQERSTVTTAHQCISLEDGQYSVAFFSVNTNNVLERHPRKQMMFTVAGSSPSAGSSTSAAVLFVIAFAIFTFFL